MGVGRGQDAAQRGRCVGGGGVAVAAPRHLPCAGVHQEAQPQGVPARGGVAGRFPPRRRRAPADGGAQVPGAGAPAAVAVREAADGGVQSRHARRGGAAGERVPGC